MRQNKLLNAPRRIRKRKIRKHVAERFLTQHRPRNKGILVSPKALGTLKLTTGFGREWEKGAGVRKLVESSLRKARGQFTRWKGQRTTRD